MKGRGSNRRLRHRARTVHDNKETEQPRGRHISLQYFSRRSNGASVLGSSLP
jgi:hypothetical protein